jgi:hypothetical protein
VWVFQALALAIVALRVYISFTEHGRLSLSIWPIIVSILGQIVFSSVSTWAAKSYVTTAIVDIKVPSPPNIPIIKEGSN